MKVNLYEVVIMCDFEDRKCLAVDALGDPEHIEVLYTPMRDWIIISRQCILIRRKLGTVSKYASWIEGVSYK